MQHENGNTSGRVQESAILLNAPVTLVWEAFTQPEIIKQWWGPNGFTNTIEKMDVRTGGEWNFIMHSPDGADYTNKVVFREVVENKQLVHEHFAPNFIATITFEEQGNNTLMHWHKLYETKELYAMVEEHHKTNEGFKQTIEKLKGYLQQHSK